MSLKAAEQDRSGLIELKAPLREAAARTRWSLRAAIERLLGSFSIGERRNCLPNRNKS